MSKRFDDFIQSARRALVLFPVAEYRPPQNSFARAMSDLRKDAARVSRGLHSVTDRYTEKYGGQIKNS